jgi:hypothetical protein
VIETKNYLAQAPITDAVVLCLLVVRTLCLMNEYQKMDFSSLARGQISFELRQNKKLKVDLVLSVPALETVKPKLQRQMLQFSTAAKVCYHHII